VSFEQKTSLFLWVLLGLPATVALGRGLYLTIRPSKRKGLYSAFEETASPYVLALLLYTLLLLTHMFMVWGTFPTGS
jgi:hypothetical protein